MLTKLRAWWRRKFPSLWVLAPSEQTLRRVEGLRNLTESRGHAEVIAKALATYDCLWQWRVRHGRVVIRGEGGEPDRELYLK